MATRPNIANRLSRAGLIGGLALASVSPVTQAQSIDSVYLPAVYHGPTSVYGQPQGLTHLASQPSLLLVTVSATKLLPQAALYEPWLSDDDGKTWRQPASMPWMLDPVMAYTRTPEFALVDSDSGPVLVALLTAQEDTWEGRRFASIFVSPDLGRTWTRHPFEAPEGCTVLRQVDLIVTPAEPRVLYAQGYCPDPSDELAPLHTVLLASDASGAHWATLPIQVDGTSWVQMSPVRAGLWYTLSSKGTLLRSEDWGGHWSELGFIPGGLLIFSPADADRLLSTRRQGAFLSLDGGESWVALNGQPCTFSYNAFGWELAGAPPIDVFSCADSTWAATRDAGKTWEVLAPPPFAGRDVHVGQADALVPGELWVFTFNDDGGGLWSMDLAATPLWTQTLRTERSP